MSNSFSSLCWIIRRKLSYILQSIVYAEEILFARWLLQEFTYIILREVKLLIDL